MQRAAVVLALGVIAVFAVATSAPASQEAVSPARVAALEKKVTMLQKTVTKARKDLDTLGAFTVACLAHGAVPVSQYGDPNGTRGYVYDNADGKGQFLTTGLDVAAQNEEVGGWFLIVHEDCAAAINGQGQSAYGIARRRGTGRLAGTAQIRVPDALRRYLTAH